MVNVSTKESLPYLAYNFYRNGLLNKNHGIQRLFTKRYRQRRQIKTCQYQRIVNEIQELRAERDNLLAEKMQLEGEIFNLSKNNLGDVVKKEIF